MLVDSGPLDFDVLAQLLFEIFDCVADVAVAGPVGHQLVVGFQNCLAPDRNGGIADLAGEGRPDSMPGFLPPSSPQSHLHHILIIAELPSKLRLPLLHAIEYCPQSTPLLFRVLLEHRVEISLTLMDVLEGYAVWGVLNALADELVSLEESGVQDGCQVVLNAGLALLQELAVDHAGRLLLATLTGPVEHGIPVNIEGRLHILLLLHLRNVVEVVRRVLPVQQELSMHAVHALRVVLFPVRDSAQVCNLHRSVLVVVPVAVAVLVVVLLAVDIIVDESLRVVLAV